MDFLECDLEEIIMNTDSVTLSKKGLSIDGKRKQQLNIGNYGRADIVTFSKEYESDYADSVLDKNMNEWVLLHYIGRITITIYELKKDKISMSSFLQAVRYAKGINDYLIKRNVGFTWDFNIVLIGKDISLDSDFVYLPDLFYRVKYYKYCIDINGLSFKEICNYSLTNKGF